MRFLLKQVRILVFVLLFSTGCSIIPSNDYSTCNGREECTTIIFVGNSMIYSNDLPMVFHNLSISGKHLIMTKMLAKGGWSLADHQQSGSTISEIESGEWEYIILQEQSEIPAFENSRNASMYPAIRNLTRKIQENGGVPIFFLTWAHKSGSPEYGLFTYKEMQDQINVGYYFIANELDVFVAPVGLAWQEIQVTHPEIKLWQDDGIHPNSTGTYLAACVFYASIFKESPEGLSYTSSISPDTASILQWTANEMVLGNR